MSDLVSQKVNMIFKSPKGKGETVHALKDISFTLKKGELLTVLGPSGCGKTTLLNIAAGFLRPTSGNITLGNKEINGPGLERGMVFQQGALFEWLTVNENVNFGLRMKKEDPVKTAKKVEEWLDIVGLQGFGNTPTYQLSGGMQQRVALARCLINDPELILMDEPLGALDKNLREQMQYEIKHIHERIGITVVYVTHDQSEALTMSNRIAVFNDGKIQQISTPDVLYEKPDNSFVAQFIGENNQLEGKVKSINGNSCVITTESGDDINALKVNVNNVGDVSTISLRPERIAINSTEKFENVFDAKIKELIYLGDHIRTRVEICGTDQFIVKVPNSYKDSNLKEGSTVKLSWKASDSRALDLN